MARSIPTDQYVNNVQDGVTQMDANRIEQLEFTNKLLALKDKAQQKEKDRLTSKYGAGHPEVKRLAARVAYNQALTPAVEANISQSKTAVDTLPPGSWRVYGFVYDSSGNPVPKVTVLLLDEKQQPIRTLPHACSDPSGYYAITLTANQLPDTKTALLGVLLPGQKVPILASQAPLQPTAGVMIYREIVLPAASCEPPPPAEK